MQPPSPLSQPHTHDIQTNTHTHNDTPIPKCTPLTRPCMVADMPGGAIMAAYVEAAAHMMPKVTPCSGSMTSTTQGLLSSE